MREKPNPFWAVAEIGVILCLFFLVAGGPPPDVNEAYYLAKAKHYWNPAWCAGDPFLESADAHVVFYWTFGWTTRLLSLAATAWVGRVLTWGLLAWAWRRLSFAVAPRPMLSILSAGLVLAFLSRFPMAGEWMIGGVEAKGFAYVLVLLAAEATVRGRWTRAWLLAGAAASFHVLVGGWMAVAVTLAAVLARLTGQENRPALGRTLLGLAGGAALALPGLAPAMMLTRGVDPAIVDQANRIYVFERLSHHLVPHLFHWWFVARFMVLALAWLGLAFITRKEKTLRPLHGLVAGAMAIALAGIAIDLATLGRPAVAAALLRYYWFRLADVMAPLGAALSATVWIARLEPARRAAAAWLTAGALAAVALTVGGAVYGRYRDFRPGAVRQSRPVASREGRPPTDDDFHTARAVYADWRNVCRWVADNTRPDDRFLTPQTQQTFKWYAGRPEAVTWKDVPQDPRGLVRWARREAMIHPTTVDARGQRRRTPLAELPTGRLVGLARRYRCRYILIDRTVIDVKQPPRPIGLERVYPTAVERNDSFWVYRVPPATEMKTE